MLRAMRRLLVAAGFLSSLVASPAAAAFPDVPASHAYREAIEYVQREGVVSGYPDGTYRPEQTINRAEFTKIVVGAAFDYDPGRDPSDFDIYALAGVPFSDVEHGAWYIPYLREARQRAVIDGYPDGTFRPGQNVNFAEAAKIVVRSFGLATTPGEPWYRPFVGKLAELQAIPTAIRRFDAPLTRGEMAEIIWRIRAARRDRPSLALDAQGSLCTPFEEPSLPGIDMEEVRRVWLSWMNEERAKEGLHPYRLNPQLNRTALLWSAFSAERGEMSHRRPGQTAYYDYAMITEWFRGLGLEFANVNRVTYSENIGRSPYRCAEPVCTQELLAAIRSTFDFYMAEKDQAEQPHYTSVMNRYFHEIGVGIALGSDGQYYITTHYATAITPDPPPLCHES